MFCSAWFSFLGLQLSDYGGSEKNSKARKKTNLISEKLVVIFKENSISFLSLWPKSMSFSFVRPERIMKLRYEYMS